jgi:hypothetical protein
MSDAAMTGKAYWFVAAVFREIDDLAAALVKLHAHNVVADGVLVLAAHLDDITRKLNHSGSGDVVIATVDRASDGWQCATNREAALGHGLRELLDAAKSADGHGRSSPAPDGNGQSRIYAQLRQDDDDGANILVASVPNPGQQLSVARILLRQKCERVLTHEIAARAC